MFPKLPSDWKHKPSPLVNRLEENDTRRHARSKRRKKRKLSETERRRRRRSENGEPIVGGCGLHTRIALLWFAVVKRVKNAPQGDLWALLEGAFSWLYRCT